MHRPWSVCAVAATGIGVLLALSQPARSGALGPADQKCDLNAADSTCHWEAKTCSRPPPAPAFGMEDDAASYNAAADRYNEYLREAQDYLQCMVKEGSADVSQAFPAVVKKAIEEKQREIEVNIQSARRNLDMSRHGMGPTSPIISPSGDPETSH